MAILSERLGEGTNKGWCQTFEGSGFPYGPVNSMDEVFSDPQVQFNNLHQTVEHSTLGQISQVKKMYGIKPHHAIYELLKANEQRG